MQFAERFPRVLILFLIVLGGALSTPAAQAAPYAAMVMDMRDGRVLHSRSADRRQHPASLTKMMTLYLTFEAVESGRVGLDQKVVVSRHAARQPASKLYLKAGQKVSIRHLIRATATKSANDAAMVLAEAIGGSQAGFGQMMTAKARQLGMRNTTFRNPHGLTQSGHLSTARDMAILARHLFYDFPDYYGVFGRISTHAAGKQIWSTNRRFLRAYHGAEGMKTGYTRAAGYNLVGIASRGQERVIAVVLGGNSTRTRNKRVMELLDMGFARAATHVAVVPPAGGGIVTAVRTSPLPPMRPTMASAVLAALAETPEAAVGDEVKLAAAGGGIVPGAESQGGTAAMQAAPAPVRPEVKSPTRMAAAAPARIVVPRSAHAPRRTELPVFRPGLDEPEPAVAEGAALGVPLPRPRPAWSVRLGEFEDRATAVESVTSITLGDLTLLASAPSEINEYKGEAGKPLYEVRFTGLTSREAGKACSTLKSRGRDCVALAPN